MMKLLYVALAVVCASPCHALSDVELGLFTSGDGTNYSVEITEETIDGLDGVTMKIVLKGPRDTEDPPPQFTISFFKSPDMSGDPSCVSEGIIGISLDGRPIMNHAHKRPRGGRRHKRRSSRFGGRKGGRSGPRNDPRVSGDDSRGCFLEADHLMGVALDGFPIYGPNSSSVPDRMLTSADLDACGGRCHPGGYRYHVVKDFPFHLGCVKGQVTSDTQNRLDEAMDEEDCDFKISCDAAPAGGDGACEGGADPTDQDAVCCNIDGDLSGCFDGDRPRFPGFPDGEGEGEGDDDRSGRPGRREGEGERRRRPGGRGPRPTTVTAAAFPDRVEGAVEGEEDRPGRPERRGPRPTTAASPDRLEGAVEGEDEEGERPPRRNGGGRGGPGGRRGPGGSGRGGRRQ